MPTLLLGVRKFKILQTFAHSLVFFLGYCNGAQCLGGGDLATYTGLLFAQLLLFII